MGFSFGGLISGAMKGVGEGMTTVAKGELENQQKLDLQKELLRLTEEKDRRVAEFTQDLAIKGKVREINEVDPLKLASDVKRTTDIGTAQTGVDVAREDALRPGKIRTAADSKTAELGVETDVTKARGKDTEYLKSRQRITDTGEGSAAKATAGAANFKLTQEKAVGDLRTKLSQAKDPAERETLTQQIQDLSGGSTRSMADMVTAGDAFRKLAQQLRKDAESAGTDEERNDMLQRAQVYEGQAASILGTTVNKRMGGNAAAAPAAGAASGPRRPGAGGDPWNRNWGSQPGNISNNPAP